MSDQPRKLKDLRVVDLRLELEKRGLQTSGVKPVLVDRLKKDLVENKLDPEEFLFNDKGASSEENEKLNENDEEDDDEQADDGAEADVKSVVVDSVSADTMPAEAESDEEKKENSGQSIKESDLQNSSDQKGDVVRDKSEVKATNVKEKKSEDNVEEKENEDDSLNIMVGDEDNLFGEEDKQNGVPSSPPRPETAPVKHPFTSKDTISLSSRSEKPPSENSSMRVNPDESQSVASHDSVEGATAKENEKKPESADEDKSKKVVKSGEDKIRNLWVSGLSHTTKATELKALFSVHSKVSGAKIVTNSRSAGARCFGYVTLSSADDADKCIEKLNKTELGGNMITVEKATAETGPNRPERHDEPRKSTLPRHSTSTSARTGERHTAYGVHHRASSHNSNSSFRRDDRRPPMPAAPYQNRHPNMRRDERNPGGNVLTFNHIKDQRKKELDREEERRRRERDRRMHEEDERRRKEAIRRQREEEDKLRREREELKREREKLEREKLELVRFEKERQRQERVKLERERQELERLRRQQMTARMGDDRRGSKRPADDRDLYQSERKRIGHREEFASGNRGAFDGNMRRPDDRVASNRYDRTSRDVVGGSRDIQSSSRSMGSSRDMGGSRSGTSSRDQGSSRDYGSREMGGSSGRSRDINSTRESSRNVGSEYRSSRSSNSHSSHASHSGSNSRSSGGISGSHASHTSSSHRGTLAGNHSSGSNWSGSKSSGSHNSGEASFAGGQGNMNNWSRSMDGNLPSQSRNISLPGIDLPMSAITPFAAQLATNAIMNTISSNSIGGSGSGNNERFDGYKPMMNNRRY